jgi:hypothetical protein
MKRDFFCRIFLEIVPIKNKIKTNNEKSSRKNKKIQRRKIDIN